MSTDVVYEIVSNQDGKVCVQKVTDSNYVDGVQYVKVTLDDDSGNVRSSVKQIKDQGNSLKDGVVAAPVTEEATPSSPPDGAAVALPAALSADLKTNEVKDLIIQLLNRQNHDSQRVDYKYFLTWFIAYIKNSDKTKIPDDVNKNMVEQVVNDTIENIKKSSDENAKHNFVYNMVNRIQFLPEKSRGGFNITRRLFEKRSNKRSSKRNGRTFRTSRSKRFGKKHGSTRRR